MNSIRNTIGIAYTLTAIGSNQKAEEQPQKSVKEGATIETGSNTEGLFFEPTVLSNCTNDMAVSCNEHFGLIAPVIPITTDEEAIELADTTDYGLSGSVFCDDLDRARTIADRIEAGMVLLLWPLQKVSQELVQI